MNTRLLVLPVTLATMLSTLGCNGVEAPVMAKTRPDEKVTGEALSVAPAPRVRGEKAPAPTPWVAPKSTKPWSELIVGKWVRAKPETFGRIVWEFTKDGKLNRCYSHPAAANGNFPAGVERGTQDYRVDGDVLFPTSTDDDTFRITESTTFIESLTDNELRIYAVKRLRRSLQSAKDETKVRKVTLEQALAEVLSEERTSASVYVRLKDKDK